jgi:hypothetical protein
MLPWNDLISQMNSLGIFCLGSLSAVNEGKDSSF